MQRTTLYKNSRIIAVAIVVTLVLAVGTVAAILMKPQEAAPEHRVDYVGRFVITPSGAEFIPPTQAHEKLTSSAPSEKSRG